MPLAGGGAAKYGYRYEGKWTVYCLASLLAAEAREISLEDPGPEGEGCEFHLQTAEGSTEYHQVKRQHAPSGDWTLRSLDSAGVLRAAFERTRDPNGWYVFVSTEASKDLADLVDLALRAGSLERFLEVLASREAKRCRWNELVTRWSPFIRSELTLTPESPAGRTEVERVAYQHVRRIRLTTADERLLEKSVDTRLALYVEGVAPEVLRAELAAYALEQTHERLTAEALWSWVEKRGYRHANYAKDTTVLPTIDSLNRRAERAIQPIAGHIIVPRPEAHRAVAILMGNDAKNSVLVSGGAGGGKSGILCQAMVLLRDAGVPFLCFRADTLEPTLLAADVGRQLGLPRSPALVLAAVAGSRPSVLVIDQLDAVSKITASSPSAFEGIREVMEQALGVGQMRLLLGCRAFDLRKDSRLRQLVSESGPAVELEADLLEPVVVSEVLGVLGVDSGSLGARLLDVLRVPLHLFLFAELLGSSAESAATGARADVDLFDAFWELKERHFSRLPGRWTDALDQLCTRMGQCRSLAVPTTALDEYPALRDAMLSERILIVDGGSIRFFHAAFFDYVFARRFASRGEDLVQYLLAAEQGLFVRPVVRQTLLYMAQKDGVDLAAAVRALLLEPRIRFHITQCALDALEQAGVADEGLWAVFREARGSGRPDLLRAVENLLTGSQSWFGYCERAGYLRAWLDAEELAGRDFGFRFILRQATRFPDECASLLSPHIGGGAEWDSRLLRVVGSYKLAESRSWFDMFLQLVGAGVIAEDTVPGFWTYLHSLRTRPAWGVEALAVYLSHCLDTLPAEALRERVFEKDIEGEESLGKMAVAAPSEYVDAVAPIFVRVVELTARATPEGLRTDDVWGFRMYGSSTRVGDALLDGLCGGLSWLGSRDARAFERHFRELAAHGEYDSVNFLLLRAASIPLLEDTANLVAEYLIADPVRLEGGWTSCGARADCAQYWAAREAVGCLSRTCSVEVLARLEGAILSHYPTWERSAQGYKRRGWWQLLMLTALDSGQRSAAAIARIDELQRKYPKAEIERPAAFAVQWVGPPIAEQDADKMSDADWLGAIEAYSRERELADRNGRLVGGAFELSRVLEAATSREPGRFARLAWRFGGGTNPYYFNAILLGLHAADAPLDVACGVVRRFFDMPGKPGSRWMSHLLRKYAEQMIPAEVLHIVGYLATEADDPETDSDHGAHVPSARLGDAPDEYLNRAINTTRGSAAEDIGYLISADPARSEILAPYVTRMVTDPTTTVRAASANALLALYGSDEDRAIDLFLELCDGAADLLLATRHVDRFLYHACGQHFSRLRPVLVRMLESCEEPVREAGARHACLAHFVAPKAGALAARCISGDDAQRRGAAGVAQANLFVRVCREFCERALPAFFDDSSAAVREEAARCFQRAKGDELGGAEGIARAFLASRSLSEHGEYLIIALTESTAEVGGLLLEACEAILRTVEESPAVGPRLYVEAEKLSELVLRAYSQSRDREYRERCLDMIDRFAAAEAYGIREQLALFEER